MATNLPEYILQSNVQPDVSLNAFPQESNERLAEMDVCPNSLEYLSKPFPLSEVAEKRKCNAGEEVSDTKKNYVSEEKKSTVLRKNIRDILDEKQLDTTTIAAQKEESERLARVVEQQKIIREYQRQTAVNRQFARAQNKVLMLLKNENTIAKVADITTSPSPPILSASNHYIQSEITKLNDFSDENIVEKTDLNETPPFSVTENKAAVEVVTIDDTSSEDDCILLSDEEDENDIEEVADDDPHNSGLHVKDAYNVPDEKGRVVVNVGHPEDEEEIYIAPQIAKIIKPHQIGGVRFLYDNIIESTKRFKTSSGFGCILAHSMGLGKTLQIVSFCDIFLRHTQSKTVLCVMPINTLQNWVSEFNMWTPRYSNDHLNIRPRQFDVFVLNDQQKTLSARAKVIFKWASEGGILLIGYELFRLLALKLISSRKRRSKNVCSTKRLNSDHNKDLLERISQALVKPGPDLVICDEGHRIKNSHAGISIALKQIRTRRRVVLTGYPLQNNLLEYWCMVDFVRPNYLGTRTEFCNMFERPIQNGQCSDSTPEDIKLMRYRAHVLHSLLVGFVQRRSHVVLQQTLPQKEEFVILTRMSQFQRSLYETFMNDIVRSKAAPNPLKAFAVCCKIWNHPDVLFNFLRKRETDLDLEIYEAEKNGEVGISSLQNNVSAENIHRHQNGEILPTSNIDHAEKLHNDTSLDHKEMQTPANFDNDLSKNNLTSTPFKIMNECFERNYSNSFTESDNNSWQDPNFSYFTHPQIPNNNVYSSNSKFIGILNDNKTKKDSDNQKALGSSVIVDLDTKEIKTVETNINMEGSVSNTKGSDFQNPISPEKKTIDSLTHPKKEKNFCNDKDTIKEKNEDSIPYEWAVELMKTYQPGLIKNSPKMEIFFCILEKSIKLNDRVLLFSQSLLTLNLIEHFLKTNKMPESENFWTRGTSYFRLDGSTTSQEREKLVNEFNTNANIKLFLISTRAGSLGINLVGANRVVIFDASWNPCHDTQAVYRIYRYGQQKPCFVYRIVMDKCLEKKIYDRQIKKQGMSDRVIDECNPQAHLTLKDVTNLCHDYEKEEDNKEEGLVFGSNDNFTDEIMEKILCSCKDMLSKRPFHHESLLVDHKEKKLSQAEKRQAHKAYEMEKKASNKQIVNYSANKFQYRIVQPDGTIVNKPVASVRPMSTYKSNSITKSAVKGMRSTRWIPAEVWQRQGMTAQEMSLPLDVVIPTNSSDKSNIILKAGQRVMVLKSAKGIYMQLDSGKIIAIRTQNKVLEPEKTQKNEVIDITSEGENAVDSVEDQEKTCETKKTTENFSGHPNLPDISEKRENKPKFGDNGIKKRTFQKSLVNDAKVFSTTPTLNFNNNNNVNNTNNNNNNSNINNNKNNNTNNSKNNSSYNNIHNSNNIDSNTDNSNNIANNQSSSSEDMNLNSSIGNPEKNCARIEITSRDVSRKQFNDVKPLQSNLPTPLSSFSSSPKKIDMHENLLRSSEPQLKSVNNNESAYFHQLKPLNFAPYSNPTIYGDRLNHGDGRLHQELSAPSFNNTLCNNSVTPVNFINNPALNAEHYPFSTNAYCTNKAYHNDFLLQYTDNFYDANNVPSTENYASQSEELSSYNPYTHAHYSAPFYRNVHHTPQTAVGPNSYMAWHNFVPSNSLTTPRTTTNSSTCAQNGNHQHEQWNIQR